MFAGHQQWANLTGINTEWDFVEAPSQMLEEWCRDEKVLQTFAKHYQTGEPIPSDMVKKMKRASVFGRGIDTAFQVFLSQLSLNLYNRDPKTIDTDATVLQYLKSTIPYKPVPDTHFQTSFGHLYGYSAIYYTYLWSLVIAKDLFSQFDQANLLDPTTAQRYRKTVLEQGGAKPAAQLVHEFLGRDFNYKAYEAYVKGQN
jgi:thimet oligopeptidase